jgi:DNA-binding CsgD family transcriptional regulator
MGDPTEAAAGGGLGAAGTDTPSGSLLERAAERGRIAAALEAARAGGGALLAIEGEAGIGKTRLLALARELAGEQFEVLWARGAELEQQLAYGVCTQLFERRLEAMSAGERERALTGAAVHAQAALGLGEGSESPNVELHGLYWLAANLAGQRPLLLLVDDLHWGDEPSLRWLHYVAGRLDGLRLLAVVATRPSDRPLVAALLADSGAPALHPAGLSEAAITGLVADRLGGDPHPAFVAACRDATLGNPFLIVELLTALVADGVAPTLDAAGGLREVRPRSIARSMLARLARLEPSATTLAQCVAVLEECSLAEAGALADFDPGLAAAAADQLAREGILRPGRPLGFVHPIVAATIVDEVPGAELAGYHARAARLLADAGADAERVALHLLTTEPAGDSWRVTQLRVAAARALARGAADVASSHLRRALAEPPPDAERAAVLAELGLAAARAGETSAPDRLREALELEPDPRERAALALVLGRVLAIPGDMGDALEVLERAIDELGDDDRELSLRLESEAITFSRYAPATVASAQRRLAALREVQGTSPGERLILAQLAIESALVGDSAERSRDLAQRALAEGALISEESSDSPARYLALHALVTADAVADAQLDLDRSLADARRRGSALGGASASMFRSHALLVGGAVAAAAAEAAGALDLGVELQLWGMVPHMAAFLVETLVERGELEEAERELARSELAPWLRDAAGADKLLGARGYLRLARGDHAAALDDLLRCGEHLRALRIENPAFCPWRSRAALAQAALGRRDAGRELADEELDLARRYGAPRAVGVALRARAMIEEGPAALELLAEAVAALAGSQSRLEHARALVDHGAALRRSGARREGCSALREGLDEARRCGALALAARAHAELEASGLRPRKMLVGGVEALTPSERRVAELAASGMANAEIAQSLFVTVKTVETHLGRSYRKLDIPGRGELAAALAQPPQA